MRILRTRSLFAAALFVAFGPTQLLAEPKGNVFVEPAAVADHQDYLDQGEYVGALTGEGETLFWGLQVVALGDGQFKAVSFPGGLPGAGWNERDQFEALGTRVDGVIELAFDDLIVKLSQGKLTVHGPDGKQIGQGQRGVRISRTLGAEPPPGATVLFDGTTADNFENGKLTSDGLLMQGCRSKQKFQSGKVHLEFRLPFAPHARGQGRGNSGMYLQGRYEVQMLDSFGLEGKHNECGGIYSIASPRINMCFPPLTWQTYDVEFTTAEYRDGEKIQDARMSVWHNGVQVHDSVALPKGTTAHPVKVGPEPGPLYLQDHGNPVRYRNIWVVEK